MKKWDKIKKDLLKNSDFEKEVKLLETEYQNYQPDNKNTSKVVIRKTLRMFPGNP